MKGMSMKQKKAVSVALCALLAVCIMAGALATVLVGAGRAGEVAQAASDVSRDLLLDDYEASLAAGGPAFSGKALNELYSAILNKPKSKYEDIAKAAADTSAQPHIAYQNILTGYDAQKIKELRGSNLSITFGGLEWHVVALTTADVDSNNDGDDDVIVTLLLKNALPGYTTPWGAFSSSSDLTYISNMYSSSLIRSKLLNGASQYTTDGSNLINLLPSNQISGGDYDKLTKYLGGGDINPFIVAPGSVPYQYNENSGKMKSGWGTVTNDNSRYDETAVDGYNMIGLLQTKVQSNSSWTGNPSSGYYAWAGDPIWLPSLTEMGSAGTTGGLWRLDASQQGGGATSWLRSGITNDAYQAYTMTAGGTGSWDSVSAAPGYAVRPALHLNLTSAELSSAAELETPAKATIEYTGGELGFEEVAAKAATTIKWWTETFKNSVTVEYFDNAGDPVDTDDGKPIDVGTYTAKITPKKGVTWADGNKDTSGNPHPTDPREVEFEITRMKVAVPTFINNKLPYAGGADVVFMLTAGYNQKAIEIVDDENNKVTSTVKKKAVGKYELTASLTDIDTYVWSNDTDSDKAIKYEVDKATIKLSLTDAQDGTAFKGKMGSSNANDNKLKIYAEFGREPEDVVQGSDEVTIQFLAVPSKNPELWEAKVSQAITLTTTMSSQSQFTAELDFSISDELKPDVLYTMAVYTTDTNYRVVVTNGATLQVEEVKTSKLTWYLYADGKKQLGFFKDADLEETGSNDVALGKQIVYDGRVYSFKVALPTGYKMVTSGYGSKGFLVEKTDSSIASKNVGKWADSYTTSIKMYDQKNGETSAQAKVYKIRWSVEKATFDLSKIEWKNDGKMPYTGSEIKLEIDPKTLPIGLAAKYSGITSGTNVGTVGQINVTFEGKDADYKANFIQPDKNDATSYIYDGTDPFPWSITWEIEPAKIQDAWTTTKVKDSNGVDVDVPVLVNPVATIDGGVVTYEYFETDVTGTPKTGTAIPLSDIVYSETEAKYYIVKAVPLTSGNYVFENTDMTSSVFRVGKDLDKITVSIDKTSATFTTAPRYVKVSATGFKGAAGETVGNVLEVSYYDVDENGKPNSKLTTAPIEVGQYKVCVKIRPKYINTYQIDGGDSATEKWFDFEVTPAIITINWKTSEVPVLTLEAGQVSALRYEIVDANDEPVAYDKLAVGTVYSIRAIIKPEYRGNVKFAGDGAENGLGKIELGDGTPEVVDYMTDWKKFSVTDPTKVFDPESPENPEYPKVEEDPNAGDGTGDDPNGGDKEPDKKGGVDMTKVKEFFQSYWKVIVTGVCFIIFLIFTLKGLQYASKRRKIKKTIKKKYGDALGALALPFGTNWLLPDNTWNLVMLIVAGVAVLSILFMILEKGLLNKAKDNLEEAKEAYANGDADYIKQQRRADEDEDRRERKRNRDREREREEEDYRRRRDDEFNRYGEEMRRQNEEMRMMFMSMMNGGYANGATAGPAPQYVPVSGGTNITIDAENIKGIITETVAALLPGMQAMLPQQAGSNNDEMVKMLADNMAEERRRSDEERRKSEERIAEERRRSDEERRKSDERMAQLMEKILEKDNTPAPAPAYVAPVADRNKNDEAMAQMMRNQEELLKQLLDKEPATVTVEKDNSGNEAYERMLKSQEELIHKLLDKEPTAAVVEDVEEEEPQTKKGKKKSKKGQVEEVADDNSEQMEQLARNQELLMQQLQDLANAPADNNNEALESIIQKLLDQQQQPVDNSNAEAIEQLARNQEMLIKQMQELANKEPQVVEVEKIIDNTDNTGYEQLIRQINELAAAHANKEPQVIERIIEKPVEKVVEKVVEKKAPAKTPAKTAKTGATAPKEKTPRLTLDEAYAKLTKEQRKFFDKLREYALSKDKCKEKKLTYHILLGQSSINPLVKLTIKNDTTVALFKMEDEYFKSIRHSAGSDGTKLKIKESELIVSDEQAFQIAKEMIDLRVDQIERYQEYVKEQKQYGKVKK